MTKREKIFKYLQILGVEPKENITLMDLKQQYLLLAKKYNPENEEYKDGKKYYEMKDAYDYLYDHIDSVNEEIHNKLNNIPDPEDIKVIEEVKEEKINNDNDFVRVNNLPNSDLQVKDRPTVFGILLSLISPLIGLFMFLMLRKVTPKTSFLYLALAIISFAINFVLVFVLPMYF